MHIIDIQTYTWPSWMNWWPALVPACTSTCLRLLLRVPTIYVWKTELSFDSKVIRSDPNNSKYNQETLVGVQLCEYI